MLVLTGYSASLSKPNQIIHIIQFIHRHPSSHSQPHVFPPQSLVLVLEERDAEELVLVLTGSSASLSKPSHPNHPIHPNHPNHPNRIHLPHLPHPQSLVLVLEERDAEELVLVLTTGLAPAPQQYPSSFIQIIQATIILRPTLNLISSEPGASAGGEGRRGVGASPHRLLHPSH